MKRRVLYFIFQWLDRFPPSVAQICTLRDMGIEVAVLTAGCNEPTRKLLAEKGVPLETFEIRKRPNKLLQKVENFFNYRRSIQAFLQKYWTDNSVFWIGTEQTAIKLWPLLKHIRPCVLTCMEFYEMDWYQKGMKKIVPHMQALTACEPHRAACMVDWWKLQKPPYLLRNKPYGTIAPKGGGSTPEIRAAIRRLEGKKVLLYQGGITADRDLGCLARSLRDCGSDYYLVLMGWKYEDGREDLLEIYDKTLYLGYFPAPSHLEITPYAHVAVAFYSDNTINNRYCAPNKIYEYAGCGIPMLCNQVPGLTETVGRAGAAECVDFSDPAAVGRALQRLDQAYDTYSRAALDFYHSTDNRPVMQQLADDIFSVTKGAKG